MEKYHQQIQDVLNDRTLTLRQKYLAVTKVCTKILAQYNNAYTRKQGTIPDEKSNLIFDYIKSWSLFFVKERNHPSITFDTWSDICEMGLDILKRYIESDEIDVTKVPGYPEFWAKYLERAKQLIHEAATTTKYPGFFEPGDA